MLFCKKMKSMAYKYQSNNANVATIGCVIFLGEVRDSSKRTIRQNRIIKSGSMAIQSITPHTLIKYKI